MVMGINHVGVQGDDPMYCEHKHQAILQLDKMDKNDAIRLLVHIIHVQQLQIVDAEIKYTDDNPFRDMINFEHVEEALKCNSPDMDLIL